MLIEAAGYRVWRIGSAAADAPSVKALQERLDALCICVSGPPEIYRVVSEQWRLPRDLQISYLLNMTPVGPAHAKRVDGLLSRLQPRTAYAECSWTGGLRALREHEAIILYGSRSGTPGEAITHLLSAIARRVVDFGDVARASLGKLLNAAATVSIAMAALENIELGRESGLPPEHLYEIVANGSGNSQLLRDCLEAALLDGDLSGDLQIDRAKRDLARALAFAEDKGLQATSASLALGLLDRLTVKARPGWPVTGQIAGVASAENSRQAREERR